VRSRLRTKEELKELRNSKTYFLSENSEKETVLLENLKKVE